MVGGGAMAPANEAYNGRWSGCYYEISQLYPEERERVPYNEDILLWLCTVLQAF